MYFYLKQKVFSLTEKFTFFDQNQTPIFTAKGSFFSMPKKFTLYQGEMPIIEIKRAFFSFMPKFTVYDLPSNQVLCEIKKEIAFSQNFKINAQEGEYRVDGSLFGFEFNLIAPDGVSIASVQKKYIAWGDTYEIWADENRIPPKVMAGIIVAIDNAVHPHK